jgi:hypothetical protein
MNSEGNEAVGELAKESAEYGSNDQHPNFLRTQLPSSLSATVQHIEKKIKTKQSKLVEKIKKIRTHQR